MIINLIFQFLIFSFGGWIIDSVYCSIYARKWVWSGIIKGVPFCPLYGVFGILLLKIFTIQKDLPVFLIIIFSSIIMIILEYLTGLLAEKILHKKLWDYSNEKPNFNDRISLWHSFIWLIGITLFYILVQYFQWKL